MTDPRRAVPRTDQVLADERLRSAATRLGPTLVKQAVVRAQERCRAGEVAPDEVADVAVAALPVSATTLRRVVNATGVVVHTNLGRAPLSGAAVEAVRTAAGATDVELDLATGQRGRRGRGALEALASAVPDAGGVHVVNNGAAALALVTRVLARGDDGRDTVVIARGELVEIGDGFRIPELMESVGARLREVGTTNRVHLADYASALDDSTAFVLKVHPSNFAVTGFTSSVPARDLAGLEHAGRRVPLVVDIGSGLLEAHPRLPHEPDAASALRAGADLVTASGDKLLGGPQAGLLLGGAELVERLRRDPFARALRVDKPLSPPSRRRSSDPCPRCMPRSGGPSTTSGRGRGRWSRRGRPGWWRRWVPRSWTPRARSAAAGRRGSRCPVRRSRCPSTSPRRCARVSRPCWAAPCAGGCCSTSWPSTRPRGRRARRGRTPCRGGGQRLMHVVATAGHVDHGKSTLVRALTGTDPDRLAEERRRGLTIEPGYAWTSWPDGGDVGDVAFVDVPGHERFLTTMLAGIGPVPAALLVVAADDPWMPQAAEHLAALDALGVGHGVVAVTRSDLADPAPAMARAAAEVSRTSLAGAPVVAVSARTGAGLDDLRAALTTMLAALPAPAADVDVRLWVDRRFTVRGAGTVVTATLPAGTVRVGDTLADGERLVRVRGLQALDATPMPWPAPPG
ncbi:L-seryl-tRNA(Sec) selenium transferase [Nocardioides sp. T5]|uniref:L-seryl-tRNA(Sec) selenium transferase n=1 Tax=Nocardioides sp. T5 TaxID=3400182 RepID=UPI003A892154